MRTNVDIDDQLMAEAQELSGLKTKREVVDAALKAFIRYQHRLDIMKLRGKVQFWDNYKEELMNMRQMKVPDWDLAEPR